MVFNTWKKIVPSEKGEAFHVGQKVSVVGQSQAANGTIDALLVNTAVVLMEEEQEKQVIKYEHLVTL
ncbi:MULTISPECIES: hypothetical protein [Enterococcus]|uniref:KOW domain-containing protein n=1 Tax=Enterococcus sulfureus ATCC 49903 TaxID=1140003 RepID=S0L0M9_9ENTE|nr:hypothetical protein [Enterococcus sulfureus]EOT45888.1 hypothetical protein OMY_01909 [Enterococcus sulfureus ATCC 49903]EOT83061.1 hypothetical protein I573_02174 [Enterococcus sulfureus ATCC 49903]